MDKIFQDFLTWITSREEDWKNQDITIEEVVESTHAHQIHVRLHSKTGFGQISLYESNNIYWVEFEALKDKSEHFYRYFEFDFFPNFDKVEKEYLNYLHEIEDIGEIE